MFSIFLFRLRQFFGGASTTKCGAQVIKYAIINAYIHI